MRIHEFCPFFNEKEIAKIKIQENSNWVDKLHIIEANKTFSYFSKPWNFDKTLASAHVHYHKINVDKLFRKPLPKQKYFDLKRCGKNQFDKWYWDLLVTNSAYYNEAVQRNLCSDYKDCIDDTDIVILADFDEILDSRYADQIVSYVKKYKIITFKLFYSVFFLNLFADHNHGAKNFSYRVYAMTGKYFKSMPCSSDYLRKKGIAECLTKEIFCTPRFMGFHHSWQDFYHKAFPKLRAFAANIKEKNIVNQEYLMRCLKDKKLYYLDANLYVDNNKPFLRASRANNLTGMWYNDND
ncbi:MAG: hypothetical protein M1561_02835 [Gammaproteobacteria bacterium]|nr:hypothetical protein [Gammaproteobacteria bacterium]